MYSEAAFKAHYPCNNYKKKGGVHYQYFCSMECHYSLITNTLKLSRKRLLEKVKERVFTKGYIALIDTVKYSTLRVQNNSTAHRKINRCS